MGGGQTIAIGFSNPDIFHSLVIMSSAAVAADGAVNAYPAFFTPAINKKIKLLWIGVGKDDALLSGSRALDAALTANGVNHIFRMTEGRHEWVVWRHHLREVAPLLFR